MTLFVTDCEISVNKTSNLLRFHTVIFALFRMQTGSNPVPATSFKRLRASLVTRLCQIPTFPISKYIARPCAARSLFAVPLQEE